MQDNVSIRSPRNIKNIRKKNAKSSKKIGSVTAVSTAKARTPSKAGTPTTAGTPSAASPLSNNRDAGSVGEIARSSDASIGRGTNKSMGISKKYNHYEKTRQTSKINDTML